MKQIVSIFLFIASTSLATVSFAQKPFANCSAAFIGSKMVVDTYTTKGQCRLPATATGQLTVQTVDLSPTISKALSKIGFTVAIRDKATNTLRMFSAEIFHRVPVQRVLATCKKGDHIVLLTTDNRYALPHNEILVQ